MVHCMVPCMVHCVVHAWCMLSSKPRVESALLSVSENASKPPAYAWTRSFVLCCAVLCVRLRVCGMSRRAVSACMYTYRVQRKLGRDEEHGRQLSLVDHPQALDLLPECLYDGDGTVTET